MIKQWIKNLIAKNKVYTPSMKEVVAEFKETDDNKLHKLIIRTDFLETENKQLKEEIKILKTNNDHICTGKLPY